jgi:hypothetical protein
MKRKKSSNTCVSDTASQHAFHEVSDFPLTAASGDSGCGHNRNSARTNYHESFHGHLRRQKQKQHASTSAARCLFACLGVHQ